MTINIGLAVTDLKKASRCFLGQRHIVTVVGFFSCLLIQSNRLVMAVGIAAMVKHKQPNETMKWNSSEISCPLPLLQSKPVVASNLQGEFDWSPELQGYVLGTGFLSYLITQAPAGRLADAVGSKHLLVFSNCLSGLLVFISPFAARWHVYALMAAQFLRGASQGITTPALFKMLSNWIPRTERGTLNGIAMCGYPVGIAMGGMVTGLLSDIPHLGWPSAFYIWGIISLLAAIGTYFVYYEHPETNPWITDEELKFITDGLETKLSKKPPATPWRKIFTSVPCYAYFYGLFGHYWGITYFLTVHPTYMETMLHYSIGENGVTSYLPALLTAFSGLLASIISHWISKKNLISLKTLRKTTTGISALGFSLCMAGILLAGCNAIANVLCFSMSLFFIGIALAGVVIAGVDMAPAFAGSVTGVSSTIAAVGSFLVPVTTGLMTTHETLSEWQKVFCLNLVVVGSSGLAYIVFGSADVQSWNYSDGEEPIEASNEGGKPAQKSFNSSIEINENTEMPKT